MLKFFHTSLYLVGILFSAINGYANYAINVDLQVAAAEGKLERVRFLVETLNANVNGRNASLDMTALLYALSNAEPDRGQCAVARYLISKRANPYVEGGFGRQTAQSLIDAGVCKGKL